MSKAKVKSKPKANTPTQQVPATFPPFKPYTKNDLIFNVFTPKDNLFYMFIAEKIEPNDFILSQNSNSFLINGPSDVQRFCYYPETKNIYSFFGFETKDKRSKAMKNKAILNSALDKVVTIYPIYQPKDSKTKIITKKEVNPPDMDYSKFPEFIKYEKDDLKFHNFIPQSNLVYVFFAEKQEPTQKILKSQFNKIYGIGYSLDIQRFRYYPGTKNIYTFMGFVNANVSTKATKTLHKVALNRAVFNYPYQKPEEDNKEEEVKDTEKETETIQVPYVPAEKLPKFKPYTKNDLEFKEFLPKKGLFYLFLPEELEPTKQILNSTYTTLYSIQKAKDIQRFCYYPHTKNLYTFIGFERADLRNVKLGSLKIKQYVVDGVISVFPFGEKVLEKPKKKRNNRNKSYKKTNITIGSNQQSPQQQQQQKPDSSDLNQKQEETKKQNYNQFAYLNDSYSYDDFEEENLENNSTEQSQTQQTTEPPADNDDNDDNDSEPLFDEKMGIHYLCFVEKNCDARNVLLQNVDLFGIKNIKEVQRGVRFPDSTDQNYYTFLGFEKTKERTDALIVLQKQTDSINIKTLQEIDEFEYDDDDDADVENDEEYEIIDDNGNDDEDDDFDDNEEDVFDDKDD